MKKGESITEFMIHEHGMLLTLFEEFRKTKNSERAIEKLKNFSEKQENHAFAEEKAIIILTQEGKEYLEIATILQQHDKIRSLLGDLKNNIKSKEKAQELLDLMKAHIILENKRFYPKLDKQLNQEDRKKVFGKITEIIIGNIGI